MISSRPSSFAVVDAMHPSPHAVHCLAVVSLAALLALSGCGGSPKTTSKATSVTNPHVTSSTTTRPGASSATGTTAHTVSRSSRGVTATLHADTHRPIVQAPWPIEFTVTRAAHAVKASVSYEYLFGGQVVAHRSHYNFKGHFSDVFKWPATAVGYPLTFRAVIASGGVTIDLDYPVQVSR